MMSRTDTATSNGQTGPAEEARVYHLLGTLYREPPDEHLEEVTTWATRWLAMDPEPAVASALEPLTAVEPADSQGLNEAFTRLFRGVTPFAPEPPYESLYRDGAMQGPSAGAVRSAYREAGVDLASDSGELADHLGIELHFVGTLLDRGAKQEAAAFVDDHPREWFASFAEAVRDRDPPAFYQGVLELTDYTLAATAASEG